jgi:hypothetical protein
MREIETFNEDELTTDELKAFKQGKSEMVSLNGKLYICECDIKIDSPPFNMSIEKRECYSAHY